ncbi:Plastocyanin-like protein [Corchorus capsularis]|uniref:Plastocyanin-like protein n=1 Tax=Corchorus capsularis TaxID=210143 RepID=A0A1R3IB93_COCAP|nr:Plastocyanin-like protein [Corchorus capsularis]
MEAFFFLVFGALATLVAGLELSKTSKDRINTSSAFNSFKNNYLVVYSLMMAGDWLQGPYVYYLYSHYGFGKGEIGQLFIAGFGSSMLFGTIVGSLADKKGRKRACVTYCITYILSCITKHSPQYKVLMLGRVLGGIATSLLFSAFESWLVAEHNKRGFDQQWLSITFSKAIFLGNGLMAILSGLFGNVLVDSLQLGPVAPFDAASCFLAIGMIVILSTWTENYGDPSENKDLLTQFRGAAAAIAADEKITLLGAIQSLFEGSMYTFVFLWTPALSPNDEDIPHGFIFATFMLSSMVGSSIASRLLAHPNPKVESYMQIVFLISSAALMLPVVTNFLVPPSGMKGGGISVSGCIQLIGFCTFEACVGIFWPSIMKMRSQYIPEEARSTIMNFFRIPLNIFVCIALYNVKALPMTVMFGMCSLFLFVASMLQRRLMMIAEIHKSTENYKKQKPKSGKGQNLLSVTSDDKKFTGRKSKSRELKIEFLLLFQTKVLCSQYKVGDLDSWGIPTAANPLVYAKWSKYHSFKIGDSLLFLYPPSQDSVIQVTEESYNSCNLKDPILYMNNGNSLFNITKPGEYFFTSGEPGHCQKKQKLYVYVAGGNGSALAPSDGPSALPDTAASPSYPIDFGSIPHPPSSSPSLGGLFPFFLTAVIGSATWAIINGFM